MTMTITTQLSSQIGDRTEEGNRRVGRMCLNNPDLLGDIAMGGRGQAQHVIGGG